MKNLERMIKTAIKAKLPLRVVGTHGIGKTAVIKKFAEENGMLCVNMHLNTLEVSDLIGLPYKDNDGATRFAPPKWVKNVLDYQGDVIIFLDELGRAHNELKNAALKLVQERILGDVVFDNTVNFVVADNPDDGDYDTNMSDPALLSRFMNYTAKADFNIWKDSTNPHQDLVKFIEHLDNFNTMSPREWTHASTLLEIGIRDVDTLSTVLSANNATELDMFMKENSVMLDLSDMDSTIDTLKELSIAESSIKIRAAIASYSDKVEDVFDDNMKKLILHLEEEQCLAVLKQLQEIDFDATMRWCTDDDDLSHKISQFETEE